MARRCLIVWIFCSLVPLCAQDFDNLQIHGFATQGFLFSSHNNYLTMNSSSGSLQWTEGAVSVSDPVTDNLRIGIQLHMFQMGSIGGPNVVVDWASGDYKFNDHLGIRAGKIKVPWGLYNDSQDVDALFLWVLLPQAMYPASDRDFDLSALGGEVYGRTSLGERKGSAQYRVYGGVSTLDSNGGYMQQLASVGLPLPSPPSGWNYGMDLRWLTPCHGLTLGATLGRESLNGSGPAGGVQEPANVAWAYYAQYERGKLHLAAEYWRTPVDLTLTLGAMTFPVTQDGRAWYPMVSYNLTKKLQVGTYYSHFINKADDPSLPANHAKDWTLSARYDFDQYFYAKLEGHFLHGTAVGYYANNNPAGLQPDSAMLAARVGFTF